MTVKSRWETITPETAQAYLTQNGLNRKVRQNLVALYAEEMAAGRWRATHQGIAFDKEGNIVDGQHRLLAIIASNTPVAMLISSGVEDYSRVAIDTGAKRTGGDHLRMLGFNEVNARSSALVWAMTHDKFGGIPKNWKHTAHPSAIQEAMERHPGILELPLIRSVPGYLISGAASLWLRYETEKIDQELSVAFWEYVLIERGAGRDISPARTLRTRLLRNIGTSKSKNEGVRLAIRAWNAAYAGEDLERLLNTDSIATIADRKP